MSRWTTTIAAFGLSFLVRGAAFAEVPPQWDVRVSPPFPDLASEQLQWDDNNVDAKTFSQDMLSSARQEPTIAVDPNDPSRMVALYTDVMDGQRAGKRHGVETCARPYSKDGGWTWLRGTPELLPFEEGQCTNGYVAAGVHGEFFSDTMVYNSEQTRTKIFLDRSDDGGQSWQRGPLLEIHVPEKHDPAGFDIGGPVQLAVDQGQRSKYRGRIYYVSEPTTDSAEFSTVFLRYSADDGKTLSRGVVIDSLSPQEKLTPQKSAGFVRGRITFGPKGEVYIFYHKDLLQGLDLFMKVSVDGGDTFGPSRLVLKGIGPFTFMAKTPNPLWASAESGFGQWIHLVEPRAAVTSDGKIWLVYAEVPRRDLHCLKINERRCWGARVFITTSTDGGQSWNQSIPVADSPIEADQFYPEIRAHPDDTVSIAWIDKRLNVDGFGYDVFYTNTRDGKSFLPNVRLSSASSRLRSGNSEKGLKRDINYLGDWLGSSVSGDGFFYIWADFRTTDRVKDIWVGRVRLCGLSKLDQPRNVCPIKH